MSNKVRTDLILGAMREVLYPRGFRKRGATFANEGDDVTTYVQLQKSAYSTRDTVQATVNLAVFSHTVHAKVGYSWEKPGELSSHWRERLGSFLPGGQDTWWTATSDAEARQAAREIAYCLERYGLPALEHVSSTEKLRALWESGKSARLLESDRRRYRRAWGTVPRDAEQ